jgi:hypothetical protein
MSGCAVRLVNKEVWTLAVRSCLPGDLVYGDIGLPKLFSDKSWFNTHVALKLHCYGVFKTSCSLDFAAWR